jgi:hypothetical protein
MKSRIRMNPPLQSERGKKTSRDEMPSWSVVARILASTRATSPDRKRPTCRSANDRRLRPKTAQASEAKKSILAEPTTPLLSLDPPLKVAGSGEPRAAYHDLVQGVKRIAPQRPAVAFIRRHYGASRARQQPGQARPERPAAAASWQPARRPHSGAGGRSGSPAATNSRSGCPPA